MDINIYHYPPEVAGHGGVLDAARQPEGEAAEEEARDGGGEPGQQVAQREHGAHRQGPHLASCAVLL